MVSLIDCDRFTRIWRSGLALPNLDRAQPMTCASAARPTSCARTSNPHDWRLCRLMARGVDSPLVMFPDRPSACSRSRHGSLLDLAQRDV